MSDPNIAYRVLLCHFDGANHDTTSIDSMLRHTLTFSGAAELSTTRPVFGTTALDGIASTSDYVQVTGNLSDFDFGNGDFAIKLRMRVDNLSTTRQLISWAAGSGNSQRGWSIHVTSSGGVVGTLYTGGTSNTTSLLGSVSTGNTYAILFERVGSSIFVAVNGQANGGTSVGTNSQNALASAGGTLTIGYDSYLGRTFPGMIDELRVTKGINDQASSFFSTYTVETAQFDDPPRVATGSSTTFFGTPTIGYFVSPWVTTSFGTPAGLPGRVTGVVNAIHSITFGTPKPRLRQHASSLGIVTHFGTGSTPTNRSAFAIGFSTGIVTPGGHVALRTSPPYLTQSGAASFASSGSPFGSPSASSPFVGAADSVGAGTVFGDATSQQGTLGEASGFSTSVFGTPSVQLTQGVSGARNTAFGAPGLRMTMRASGSLLTQRFGTPAQWGPHMATGFASGAFGQPRSVRDVRHASGWSETAFGAPEAIERHRVSPLAPHTAFGTPKLIRGIPC